MCKHVTFSKNLTRKAYFPIPVLLIVAVLIFLTVSTSSSTSHLSKSSGSVVVLIKGGLFNRPNTQIGGTEKLTVKSFYLDKNLTTVAEFNEFVKKISYVTEADKFGNSAVFVAGNWELVDGADYLYPLGKDKAKPNHPVTQVSWFDAVAYSKWAGKRLPTEAEWEFAARGGLVNNIYSWGNENVDAGEPKANSWQGNFPNQNTLRDKFYGASPVKSFKPNGYGLYDISGNVWEWCADFYHSEYYKESNKPDGIINPKGPGKSYDPQEPYAVKRVLRGGSFLCNDRYCSGYRNARRMKSSEDTSMEHTGFRCVADK